MGPRFARALQLHRIAELDRLLSAVSTSAVDHVEGHPDPCARILASVYARPGMEVRVLDRTPTWMASFGVLYATSQLQHRLLPLLSCDRGLVPELPVTLEDPNTNGTILCEPPAPPLMPLRTAASFSVRLLG